MVNALLMAFAYWLCQWADGYVGWQTFTRPIVLGPICGLLFGDLKTGVILGTELEAVYMGVSSIGGEAPSNYQAATVMGVGFVILTGVEMEIGLALAVTIGTLINAAKPFTNAIKILFHPMYLKIAETGDTKKFRRLMWLQLLLIDQLIPTIIIFLVALGGEVGLQAFLDVCPAFILNGLSAASGMLVVVGLCLTTQAIWNGSTTVMFVLLGFVLSIFLGLDTLPIAIVGVVIAYMYFITNNKIKNAKAANASLATADSEGEGDDFFE